MSSSESEFWDRRYREEGAIWGDAPSLTAVLASRHLRAGDRVLDVGFGYGRDMAFLLRSGFRCGGIDLSSEGRRQAEIWFRREGLRPDWLWTGRFEDSVVRDEPVDAVLSHRLAHLLLSRAEIGHFAARVEQWLAPSGLLAIGARDPRDLKPEDMICLGEGVYEYRQRPGHRIRYWDEGTFREAFGAAFTVVSLTEGAEKESVTQPVPCHFTVLIARQKPGSESRSGESQP
jgi:hypothetical protein